MKSKETILILIAIGIVFSIINLSFHYGAIAQGENLMEGWVNEFTPKEAQVQQKMESKTIRSLEEVHPDETHQHAVILPPTGKIYEGIIAYSSSENIQPAVIHGALEHQHQKGQFIVSLDGKTKFALTTTDEETTMGTYHFVGNGLVLHSINDKPFTVSYSVSYEELNISE